MSEPDGREIKLTIGGSEFVLPIAGSENGLNSLLENIERFCIESALQRYGGNLTEAGKILNTPFRHIRYRVAVLGIDVDSFRIKRRRKEDRSAE